MALSSATIRTSDFIFNHTHIKLIGMKHTQFKQLLEERKALASSPQTESAYTLLLYKYEEHFKLELLEEAKSTEENDLKAINLHNQVVREKRIEIFNADWKQKIILSPKVITFTEMFNDSKIIYETNEFGTIDFYPKANKILIRKDNAWKEKGLNWLIKNLLENEA